MSVPKIRFLEAPPVPETVDEQAWWDEWRGLVVSYRPPLCTVGYLGDLSTTLKRIWNEEKKRCEEPTPVDSMKHISALEMWRSMVMVKRGVLSYVCSQQHPTRPLIVAWLNRDPQLLCEEFLVPLSMVEIIS